MSSAVSLLDEGVQRLAEGIDDEANLAKPVMIEDVTTIEDKGRLHHGSVDALKVVFLELIPLCQDADGMAVLGRLIRILHDCDGLCLDRSLPGTWVIPLKFGGLQIRVDLVFSDLGIIDEQLGIVSQQPLADIDSWGLTGVASVLLESKAQHCNFLARDGIEHGLNDPLHKTLFLVVVDGDHLQTRELLTSHTIIKQDCIGTESRCWRPI